MNDNIVRVVIDSHMGIITADNRFFSLIGEENHHSLLRCMDPEDLDALRAAIGKLTGFHDNAATCCRIRTVNGPRWFMIRAHMDKSDPDEEGQYLFYLEGIDMDTLQEQVSDLMEQLNEANKLLEICDRQLFRYDRKTDDLRIFGGSLARPVGYFHGSLAEWTDKVHTEVELTEDGRESFENLLTDLTSSIGPFEDIIKGRQKTDSAEQGVARFLGATIRDETVDVALGSIRLMSANGQEENVHIFGQNNYDEMTGLFNKQAIRKYAERVFAQQQDHPVHLVILDLDNFKNVNDTYGHLAGDEALRKAGGIIRDALGSAGVAGRFGGDEISLIIEKADTLMALRSILRSIRTNIEHAYRNTGKYYEITCSMGVATLGIAGTTFEEVFNIADKMLYGAKMKGKNRYIIYTPELHASLLESETFTPKQLFGSREGDREGTVNRVIEYLLGKKRAEIAGCLAAVGQAFSIDEISLFTDSTESAIYTWLSPDWPTVSIRDLNCLKADGIDQWIARDNPLVVDSVEHIRHIYPVTAQVLQDNRVHAAMIFSVLEEGHRAWLVFGKKNVLTRKWADSDKAYLMFVSNAVGLRLEQDFSKG